jgi:hypothetical protein
MSVSGLDGGAGSADQANDGHSADSGATLAGDVDATPSDGGQVEVHESQGGRAQGSRDSQTDDMRGTAAYSDGDSFDFTRGRVAGGELGGDQAAFASTRGPNATSSGDREGVDFASSRETGDLAQDSHQVDQPGCTPSGDDSDVERPREYSRPPEVAGRGQSSTDRERELEIPSEHENDYYRDAGDRAADGIPEDGWRSADIDERRRMACQAYDEVGEGRLSDASGPGVAPLQIRELHAGEYEGLRVDNRYVVIDEARLRSDDPSGAVGAIAKAHQYDYQEQRIAGGYAAIEGSEQRIEDGRWRGDTPDYVVDTREPYAVDDGHAYDMNSRVADARAAECNVRRQYWHRLWKDDRAAPALPTNRTDGDRPANGRATVRGNDADFDLSSQDVATHRDAGDHLSQALPPEGWSEAGLGVRRQMAAEANDIVRADYGLPAQHARFADLGPGVSGSYCHADGTLSLSEDLLADDDPDQVFDTILHENCHNVQWNDIVAKGTGSRWYVPHRDYPQGINGEEPSAEDIEKYAYNELELDSRSAAGVGMDQYWKTAARRRAGERG